MTFSTLKEPIQHEPIPEVQAAITMFCRAIVVSTTAHFPVRSDFSSAQPTITKGAFLMCFANKLLDNSSLAWESVTTANRMGCLLTAGGACLPASRTWRKNLVVFLYLPYFRILLRLKITSNKDNEVTGLSSS